MGKGIKICKNCGEKFKPFNSRQIFCDPICKQRFHEKQRPVFDDVCPVCGKVFQYKMSRNGPRKHYCSTSCQLKATVPIKECTCIDCGAKFLFKGRCTKLRCEPCRKKHVSLETMKARFRKDPTIKIGVGSGNAQTGNVKATETPEHQLALAKRRARYAAKKEYMRASHHTNYRYILTGNDACALCGYNLHQEALVVHHKDQDRTHNDRSNLVVLCSNCHMLVHNAIREAIKQENHKTPTEIFEETLDKANKSRVGQSKTAELSGNELSISQPEPKAGRDSSQGQSVPAGEDLPSADKRPRIS